MAEAIDGTAAPEHIATKLTQSVDEIEDLVAENGSIQTEFENNEWSGVDQLADIRRQLDEVRDDISNVAEKVGLAERVKDAFHRNRMVGNHASLGRS